MLKSSTPASPRALKAVPPAALQACFFATGAASLTLEIVWTKYLSYLLGNSVYGVATVVASFLGGLGIGAALGGRLAARSRAPLLVYAALETTVGVLALASPLLQQAARPLFAFLYGALSGSATLFFVVRFLVLFCGLFVPTIAMGATLPILVGELAGRRGAVPDAVTGRLYAVNTAGGVTGVLTAGFVLVPMLGLWKSAVLAGLVDISVAAWIFSRRPGAAARAPGRAPAPAAGVAERGAAAGGAIRASAPLARALAVLSGFTAILYQVAWTRILSIPFGGIVYAFSAILAIYLAGIALGAAGAARLLRRSGAALAVFGLLQAALAGAVASGAHLFARLPHLVISALDASRGSVARVFAGEAGIAALIVFVPTLLLGAIFPIVVAVHRSGRGDPGRSVGVVYAANTVGSISGALLAAFVLIPLLGSQRTILWASLANVAMAVVALLLGEGPAWRRRVAAAGVAGAAALYALTAVPGWNPERMSFGLVRLLRTYATGGAGMAHRVIDAVGSGSSAYERLLFYREGRVASVSVVEVEQTRSLLINGKADASVGRGGDMPTQILVGQLPLLFSPGARDVCIVGFGSGVTAGAVLSHPVRHALTLELERAVVDAAPFFRPYAGDPLHDPRSELQVEDAGTFLRSTRRTFDVIVSQPSNLWIAGMADLFTRDFYRAARARLRPGGVFCQWMQCYWTAPATVQTVFRTLTTVFPHGQVFYLEGSADLIIVASADRQLRLDEARFAAAMSRPEVAENLVAAGVSGPEDLLRFYRGRLERLGREAGPGDVNTDDNGILEHRAPFDLLAAGSSEEFLAWTPAVTADLVAEVRENGGAAGGRLLERALERARAAEDAPAAAGLAAALDAMDPAPSAAAAVTPVPAAETRPP